MFIRDSLASERLTMIFTIQGEESDFLVKVDTAPDDIFLSILRPILAAVIREKGVPVSVVSPRSFIETKQRIQGYMFLAESHPNVSAAIMNLLAPHMILKQ